MFHGKSLLGLICCALLVRAEHRAALPVLTPPTLAGELAARESTAATTNCFAAMDRAGWHTAMPATFGSIVELAVTPLFASCPATGSSDFGRQDVRTGAASFGSSNRRVPLAIPPPGTSLPLLLFSAAGVAAAGPLLTGSASKGFNLSCAGGQALAGSSSAWASASAARTIAEGAGWRGDRLPEEHLLQQLICYAVEPL